MTLVLIMFTIQCLIGAFDNLWHHELEADLPHAPNARGELALHTARELLYALIFGGIAWYRWQGLWTWALMAVLAIEILITIADFVVEDQTRRLPPLERVLHTILALNYGALLALWAPELRLWLSAPTGLVETSYGLWSWAMSLFSLGVFAWGLRDLYAVADLAVPRWHREPLLAGNAAIPRVILVTGGTGFIGQVLVRQLIARGDQVIVLSRNPARARDRFGPWVEVCGNLGDIGPFREIDAIINLAGAPVIGGLWTRARRRLLMDSRLTTTRQIVELIERLHYKPQVLISASAIGYYGERGDQILDERATPAVGFLSQLCQVWEAAATAAAACGVRVCQLRIGLVLGPNGGVLKPLTLATRFGGGAVLGSGCQWQSWIHRDDLLRLIHVALEDSSWSGPINAVAPGAVSQRTFACTLGHSLNRPVLLRVPAWLLRSFLGELSDLFLISQRVTPARALASGFEFHFPELSGAFRNLQGNELDMRHRQSAAHVHFRDDLVLCRLEIGLYQRAAARTDIPLRFTARIAESGGFAAYGLGERDLRRRLYARCHDGTVRSGIDAAIAIWRALPKFRWIVVIATVPGVRIALSMTYDLIWMPLLSLWPEGASGRRSRD